MQIDFLRWKISPQQDNEDDKDDDKGSTGMEPNKITLTQPLSGMHRVGCFEFRGLGHILSRLHPVFFDVLRFDETRLLPINFRPFATAEVMSSWLENCFPS